MRKALLAATALVGSVMFLVPGAQAFDWNGPYVGGVVGVVKSTGDINFTYYPIAVGPETLSFDGMGALGGVTVGYNYVLNNFVIGVEADASATNLSSTTTASDVDWDAEAEETLKSLLTLRARFGIANGPALFYATAGFTGGSVSSSTTITDFGKGPADPTTATTSGFAAGVIGGVGVEYAFSDNLSAKIEALGYSLGDQTGVGDTGKGDFDATYKPSGLLFRAGINFHF